MPSWFKKIASFSPVKQTIKGEGKNGFVYGISVNSCQFFESWFFRV